MDYDPNTNSLLVGGYGNTPANLGVNPDLRAWAPRLGLAYRLNEKTVIRAGFGTSYLFALPASRITLRASRRPTAHLIPTRPLARWLPVFLPPPFVTIPQDGIIPS